MSLAIQISGQEFNGTNDTVTPYPVNFPLQDEGDLYVSIKLLAAVNRTVLDRSAWTLHKSGEVYSVTTNSAQLATTKVMLFRWVGMDQPFEFPAGGEFSTKEIERAFDRIVMQIQQLLPGVTTQGGGSGGIIVVPSSSSPILGIQTVADATARAAAKPAYVGQLAIQLSDRSEWIGTATTVGAWSEFRPVVVTTPLDKKITLALTSNTMVAAGSNAAIATAINALSPAPDFVLFAGDGTQSEATFEADWAAFASWIAAQKAGLALGNADISGATTWALPIAKFSYLGWTNRNWTKSLGNGLVDIFAIHSGVNNSFTMVETDGVAEGSAQHIRFQAWLAASTAKYKLAVMHHPPMTSAADDGSAANAIRWPELTQLDAILTGHRYWTEIASW